MCDDFTAIDDEKTLAKRGLNRRQFAAMSAVTVGAMGISTACAAQDGGAGPVETAVSIPTPDGTMDGFFFHPAEGKHAAVIMWPDIAGVRDAKMVMARELAARGYAVVLVNQYYRTAKAPIMSSISEFFQPGARERLGPMMAVLSNEGTMSDARAIVAWLDAQPQVDTAKKIGVEGYCMTGSYAIRCAAAVPERIGAVSSFHGGGLVSDAPDSPHKLLGPTAYYLIAIARNDDERNPGEKEALRLAAEDQGAGARIEVFAGDHGWMVPDAPAYHEIEAMRGREMSLFHYAKL
ncbi:MAG TPA: dienelactone hydrolase family protein [Sphingomonadaceae bacterium]|nr:dienelactone hydrolase family protein [Sphingomonadaceae bacterium]